MSEYIGPLQRDIITAMQGSAQLYNQYGVWSLRTANGDVRRVSRERCMGLYMRGFIMGCDVQADFGQPYVLTEKGKRI